MKYKRDWDDAKQRWCALWNGEPLVKELDPSLLCINTYCRSVAEADDLLEAAGRRYAKQVHS